LICICCRVARELQLLEEEDRRSKDIEEQQGAELARRLQEEDDALER
jgi:hypothetical protein